MTDPAVNPAVNPASESAATSTTTASSASHWTTRKLLHWVTGHFRERNIDGPRVCAEMLLGHVIGCERMRLYMEVDRPASPEELTKLRELVKRAAQHEPVQYLVGHAWFFSRRFEVNSATLIPRPSTETLVELGVRALRERVGSTPSHSAAATPFELEMTVDPEATIDVDTTVELDAPLVPTAEATAAIADRPKPVRVLDLCTGTGCIAISIAASIPGATIVATDLVPEAIELAQRNAAAHDVGERLDFRVGSLWQPVASDDGPFDLICANPPYISDPEWAEVPPNVRDHEPASALRAGVDGLDLIRTIVAEARRHLASGGTLLVEIAASQGAAAAALARTAGFTSVHIERDHEGHDRVLVARNPV